VCLRFRLSSRSIKVAEADTDVIRGDGFDADHIGSGNLVECRCYPPSSYASGWGNIIVFICDFSPPGISSRRIAIGFPWFDFLSRLGNNILNINAQDQLF
jgi:hypothetical protein